MDARQKLTNIDHYMIANYLAIAIKPKIEQTYLAYGLEDLRILLPLLDFNRDQAQACIHLYLANENRPVSGLTLFLSRQNETTSVFIFNPTGGSDKQTLPYTEVIYNLLHQTFYEAQLHVYTSSQKIVDHYTASLHLQAITYFAHYPQQFFKNFATIAWVENLEHDNWHALKALPEHFVSALARPILHDLENELISFHNNSIKSAREQAVQMTRGLALLEKLVYYPKNFIFSPLSRRVNIIYDSDQELNLNGLYFDIDGFPSAITADPDLHYTISQHTVTLSWQTEDQLFAAITRLHASPDDAAPHQYLAHRAFTHFFLTYFAMRTLFKMQQQKPLPTGLCQNLVTHVQAFIELQPNPLTFMHDCLACLATEANWPAIADQLKYEHEEEADLAAHWEGVKQFLQAYFSLYYFARLMNHRLQHVQSILQQLQQYLTNIPALQHVLDLMNFNETLTFLQVSFALEQISLNALIQNLPNHLQVLLAHQLMQASDTKGELPRKQVLSLLSLLAEKSRFAFAHAYRHVFTFPADEKKLIHFLNLDEVAALRPLSAIQTPLQIASANELQAMLVFVCKTQRFLFLKPHLTHIENLSDLLTTLPASQRLALITACLHVTHAKPLIKAHLSAHAFEIAQLFTSHSERTQFLRLVITKLTHETLINILALYPTGSFFYYCKLILADRHFAPLTMVLKQVPIAERYAALALFPQDYFPEPNQFLSEQVNHAELALLIALVQQKQDWLLTPRFLEVVLSLIPDAMHHEFTRAVTPLQRHRFGFFDSPEPHAHTTTTARQRFK